MKFTTYLLTLFCLVVLFSGSTAFATTATSVSLKSSLPNGNNVTCPVGTPITFTATVTPSVPNGETVTLYSGTTLIASAPTKSSVATLPTSILSEGSDNLTATYVGDANFSSSISPVVNQIVLDSEGRVNVIDYGAIGNRGYNDDAPFASAFAAALLVHMPIHVPAGTYMLTKPLVLNGVDLTGEGRSSVLQWHIPLGVGVPALSVISVPNQGNPVNISNLCLVGPATSFKLGVKQGVGDGLGYEALSTQGGTGGYVTNVSVKNFDSGFVIGNYGGHTFLRDCQAAGCYYDVYIPVQNSGDYSFDTCGFGGAAMASIGVSGQIGTSFCAYRTNLGFSPFGIYQEPANGYVVGGFLNDVKLIQCKFEACGNAAIYTAVPYSATGGNSVVSNLQIQDAGFRWDSYYQIPGLPHSSAVVLSVVQGHNVFDCGGGAFTSSISGAPAYSFAHLADSGTTIYQSGLTASQVTTGTSNPVTVVPY